MKGANLSSQTIKTAFAPLKATDTQQEKIQGIETKFADTATFVNEVVPPGPMKEKILDGLLAVKFNAVHAITHGSDTWGVTNVGVAGVGGESKLPYNS